MEIAQLNKSSLSYNNPYIFEIMYVRNMAGEHTLAEPRLKVTTWFSIPTFSNQCAPTSSYQCPYQVSTSYTLQFLWYNPDMNLKLKVNTATSKVKTRSDHEIAYLHPLTNVSNFYTLRFLRYSPDKIFQTHGHYRKIKSRSHHDIGHLYPPSNVPTEYQLPAPYGFWVTAQTKFLPPARRPLAHLDTMG